MKKRIAFLLLYLIGMIAAGVNAQVRVIDTPPYMARNTGMNDITRIERSDTATVVHLQIVNPYKFADDFPITVPSTSVLQDEQGNRYPVRSAHGIEIDKEKVFSLAENDTASYTLYFPPLSKEVKTIDYKEGEDKDASDYRKNTLFVYGIKVDGSKRIKLPRQKPLPRQRPVIKDSLPADYPLLYDTATLEGEIVGYRPEMGNEVMVCFSHPLICPDQKQHRAAVDANGRFSFSMKVLGLSRARVLFTLGNFADVMLEPGQTTRVRINMATRSGKPYGKKKPGKNAMPKYETDSPWQDVFDNMVKGSWFRSYYNYRDTLQKLNDTPQKYKDYVLTEMGKDLNNIRQDEMTEAAREMMTRLCKAEYASILGRVSENSPTWLPQELLQAASHPCLLPFVRSSHISLLGKRCSPDSFFGKVFKASQYSKSIDTYRLMDEQALHDAKAELPAALYDFLYEKNQALADKLAEMKAKSASYVNTSDEIDENDPFNSLISRYRGKTILIDFWNTWCGPCRLAHERMEPIKATMQGEDVVFLYLADESSPEETWKKMIKDIPGEHFRLNKKQEEYLDQQLEIDAFPTYLIVNPEGIVTYRFEGFPGAEEMQRQLQRAKGNK